MSCRQNLLGVASWVAILAISPAQLWAQVSDTTPPVVAGVSVSPADVEVTGGDPVVTVTVQVTDVLANLGFDVTVVVLSDGLPDLLLHFKTAELQLGRGMWRPCSRGATCSGDLFRGIDSIRLVP